ncbi:MAG: DNA starvation/stationary phase protection protein Dps, partial [Beijerinckiaceae bacterium]
AARKSNVKPLDSTRIDIERKSRVEMTALLNDLLADASDLSMQCKNAHWNVKGPHFIGLHKLFDELYAGVGEHIDEIAERIGALGGYVKGRIQDAHAATRLKAYPTSITDGMDHVRALADAFGKFANALREGIEKAEDAEDMVTSDMLTGINGAIDKDLWFLEAHLRG